MAHGRIFYYELFTMNYELLIRFLLFLFDLYLDYLPAVIITAYQAYPMRKLRLLTLRARYKIGFR